MVNTETNSIQFSEKAEKRAMELAAYSIIQSLFDNNLITKDELSKAKHQLKIDID